MCTLCIYTVYIYTHYIVYTYIHIYIGYKYGLSQNMVHTSICNRKVAHHFSMCFLIEMAIKSTAYGIFGSGPAPILTIITLHIYIYIYIHIHIYMFERYSYLCWLQIMQLFWLWIWRNTWFVARFLGYQSDRGRAFRDAATNHVVILQAQTS